MTLTDDDTSFGTLVKALRLHRRRTQQQLADALGVHRRTVIRWEQGNYLPESKAMVLELARHLKLDAREARQLLEASLTALAPHWSVPLPRNLYFTGREEILEELHTRLGTEQAVALTQSSALHGLGGVGKTQIALEYAYRYALEYSAVFWIEAGTSDTILSSLLRIADVLRVPERQAAEYPRVVAAVQRWLRHHDGWLLIWDNLDDLELLPRLLPAPIRQGALLLTTRCQVLGTLAHGREIAPLAHEEGIRLVLRRARLLSPEATEEQVRQFAVRRAAEYTATRELVATMQGLPLALDQAGAYLEETGCHVATYLQHYMQHPTRLLDRRGALGSDHPHSVVATFRLAMEHVAREQPIAVEVLRVCACLHPEAIPEELFVEGAAFLGPEVAPLAADPLRFDQAMAILRSLSLVQRHPETRTLSLHRLLHVVVRDQMNEYEHSLWLGRLSETLNHLFPADPSEARCWGRCERLLIQVSTVAMASADHAGSQALAEVLRKAADYVHERAQYAQAEQLYRRALHAGEHVWGADHPALARTLVNLALLSQEQGALSQAETFGERALRLCEQTQGRDLAHCLTTLAVISTEQGKNEQAEALFRRVLPLLEQGGDLPGSLLAHALHWFALLFWRQGKYEQAEPLLLRAIALREHLEGPASRHLSSPLHTLALLFWKQGRYMQAETVLERARQVWEQGADPAHPQCACVLTGQAILSLEQGRYAQAELAFARALEIWEHTWEPEHPQIALALANLGEVSALQGKNEQAEQYYLRAWEMGKHVWRRGHPYLAGLLTSLADLYSTQGKDMQAESLLRQALALWERGWGLEHPDAATTLNSLATLAVQQGKDEQAEELFQRALSAREHHLGPEHPETAQTLHDLALFRQAQGKVSEACALAQRTLQIRVQSLGDTHPKTVASYTLYAQVLEASGTRQAGTVCSREAAAYPNRLRTAHPQQEAAITLQGTSHESLSRDDPLQRFLDLCCELHPLAWCRISELWHAYLVWTASAQKRVPLSRRAFTAQIKARGCRVDRTNSARIWRGIRLVKAHPASP